MYPRTFSDNNFVLISIGSSRPPAAQQDNWFRGTQRGNAQRAATKKFELPLAQRDNWFPGFAKNLIDSCEMIRQQRLIDSWATPGRG